MYPLLRDDSRYLDMLGNPGSNQLELFWDVVDGLDQKLDAKIAAVEEVIDAFNTKNRPSHGDGDVDMEPSSGFKVGTETTEEEYNSVLKQSPNDGLSAFSEEELHQVFVAVSRRQGG